VSERADDVLGTDLATKLRRFIETRESRDEAAATAKRLEEEYRQEEAELWDALEDSPMLPPYKVDLGEPHGIVTFQNKETYYGRIIDEEKAQEYLEQTAQVDEFSKPKFVMARVHELVRSKLEAQESPPDGFDFYAKRYISISRPK
jgi:hypothetical protein